MESQTICARNDRGIELHKCMQQKAEIYVHGMIVKLLLHKCMQQKAELYISAWNDLELMVT